MLDVFWSRCINSYSSFSRSATFCSISMRLLFSSRILFMSLLRCCYFLSRISYKQKNEVTAKQCRGHLRNHDGPTRPTSASLSSPWSMRSSSSPLPSNDESLGYSFDFALSINWHHSTTSVAYFDSIMPLPSCAILFLVDFSLVALPLRSHEAVGIVLFSSCSPLHFDNHTLEVPALQSIVYITSSSDYELNINGASLTRSLFWTLHHYCYCPHPSTNHKFITKWHNSSLYPVGTLAMTRYPYIGDPAFNSLCVW